MTTKKLLLDARKAIEAKEFQNCLQICQEVFKEDKKNYTAFCYSGLAYQKLGLLDDSKNAYEQAISIQPETGVAWQVDSNSNVGSHLKGSC